MPRDDRYLGAIRQGADRTGPVRLGEGHAMHGLVRTDDQGTAADRENRKLRATALGPRGRGEGRTLRGGHFRGRYHCARRVIKAA